MCPCERKRSCPPPVDPWLNVAVTLSFPVIETLQAPVPLHAPPHPPNVDPEAGEAERLTFVPLA